MSEALAGVIIGGTIGIVAAIVAAFASHLSAQALEDRRWQQRKTDLRREKEREALEQALEWMTHVYNALMIADTLAWPELPPEESRRSPSYELGQTLSELDLHRSQLAIIHRDLYKPGFEVLRRLSQARALARSADSQTVSEHLSETRRLVDQWNDDLESAYRRTFD